MTAAGWLFLATSWACILGLFAFCLSRILRPRAEKSAENHAAAKTGDE